MPKAKLPKEARQQFKVALDFIKQRDVNAARSQLLEIELGSSLMLFHRMMAGCAFIDEDYDLASAHIEQAIALEPTKQSIIADAIRIYKAKNDDRRALELCHSFSIADANSSSELLRISMAMKSLGKDKEAASVLEKALRLSPENVRIRNQYGSLLARLDLIANAKQQWLFSLKFQPNDIQALLCLGRFHLHLKEYLKAIDYFKESLAVDSKNVDARKLDLAEAYLRASSANEARELLSSIDTLESAPRFHYLWGLLHSLGADHFLAYSSFSRCVNLARDSGDSTMKQLHWPDDFPGDELFLKLLNESQPSFDFLFDPLNMLKSTNRGIDCQADDEFSFGSDSL